MRRVMAAECMAGSLLSGKHLAAAVSESSNMARLQPCASDQKMQSINGRHVRVSKAGVHTLALEKLRLSRVTWGFESTVENINQFSISMR